MDFSKWQGIYSRIIKDFPELDFTNDILARDILLQMTDEQDASASRTRMNDLITDRDVVIIGGGGMGDNEISQGYTIIACDGACVELNQRGIAADIVVTDLDSPVKEIKKSLRPDGVAVIHGHGDNIDALEQNISGFKFNTLPTTQVGPKGHVSNFGGFTDGDRAIFLALHFRPSSLRLLGFDFRTPGEFSYHKDIEVKKRKLKWAEKLLSMAQEESAAIGVDIQIL